MPKPTTLPPKGWVRETTILAVVPYGRTKLLEEIAAGRFPPPKHFAPRIKAYDAELVHRWIEAQRQTAPV